MGGGQGVDELADELVEVGATRRVDAAGNGASGPQRRRLQRLDGAALVRGLRLGSLFLVDLGFRALVGVGHRLLWGGGGGARRGLGWSCGGGRGGGEPPPPLWG